MDAWSSPTSYGTTRTAEFMAAVYRWMAFGLGLTGLVAYAVFSSPGLQSAFFQYQEGRIAGVSGLFWLCGIAELVLVFAFSASVMRVSQGAAVAMFLGYCALSGVTFSVYLFAYTAQSIASTLFITGGAFLGLSLYGTTTKRDLTAWRSFLMIGLIGIVLAGIVNIFLRNNAVEFVISCAGVLVFAGLTAYDTQKLRAIADAGHGSNNLALQGALALYLDFINLFILLLRFVGRRRED